MSPAATLGVDEARAAVPARSHCSRRALATQDRAIRQRRLGVRMQSANGRCYGIVLNQQFSTRARELLGWEPTGPAIFDDIERGSYAA